VLSSRAVNGGNRRKQEGYVTTAHAPQAGGSIGAWGKFRRWRRTRPFWGGLFLLLSGLELFLSGNMNLGALQVHFGPTGFLSYVIPAMVLLCGLMAWVTPNLRLFYGVLGSLVAVYSLIGLNFGGFVLGLLLGIIGGALTIAWTPVNQSATATPQPAAAPEPPAPAPEEETEGAWFLNDSAEPGGYPDQRPRYDHGQPYEDAPAYSNGPVYGNSRPADAQTEEIPREVQNPERWWGNGEGTTGHGDPEPPPHGGASGGYRTRMFAITLVPVTLAAVALMAVNHSTPAYALPCPNPSASASTSATPKSTPKTAPKPAATKAPGAANGAGQPKAPQQTEPTPSPTPTPTATSTGTGNPFVDGWNDFVDGVKKFFGGGDTATPDPTPSASASPSTSTGGTGNSGGAPTQPGATDPAQPPPPADPGSSTGAPSASTVPCLGPGVIKSAAVDPGQPPIAATQAVLTTASLTMYNSTYDGVVDLPTRTGGTVHSLKFSMSKAVNKPFQLKVREPNGKNTVITSTELVTEGNVKFYTPKFTGKLFGLIPVTFTPDSPPPLTLPVLWFTDVTIDLAFVNCNTLTTQDMHLSEE
jgi:Family of unknown function (DUF6114)